MRGHERLKPKLLMSLIASRQTALRGVAGLLLFGGWAIFGSRVWAADLALDPLFNDGAVLQAEMPVNVWGRARPGADVVVRFGEVEAVAQADDDGRWLARLPALPHSSEARSLQVAAGEEKISLNDVLVGEVWLAAGQSNMVWALSRREGGREATERRMPLVRFVTVPTRPGPPFGRALSAAELAWTPAIPGKNRGFSAVAFFFAGQLQEKLGVPVGIVQSAVGATPAQAWTPLAALQAHEELKHYAEQVQKGLAPDHASDLWTGEIDAYNQARATFEAWRKKREGPRPPAPVAPRPENPHQVRFPTGLYENMIAPLVPYTFRGVIWYQGEGNATNPGEYRTLFPALIASWREAWNQPEWPFLFVQLAAFNRREGDWPGLRAAQAFTRDTVPHTGMALAIDCGEEENIHPARKRPVGERLAALALNQVYGREVPARGPLASHAVVAADKILVYFDQVNGALRAEGEEVHGVEIVEAGGRVRPAAARLAGRDHIEIPADPDVREVTEVRYAWRNWVEPPANLQDVSGLPAEPFLLLVQPPGSHGDGSWAGD